VNPDTRRGQFVRPGGPHALLVVVLVGLMSSIPGRAWADGIKLLPGLRVDWTTLPEFQPAPDPDPIPADDPGAVLVEKGQEAPFSGLLISADRMIWYEAVVVQRDKLKVQVEETVDLAQTIQATALEGMERAAKAAEPKWYESPEVNRWGGFLLGLVLVSGVVGVAVGVSQAVD